MALVASATKGLAGLTMAIAHSRGFFDYDDPVAKYWPEFAQQGKDKITIRLLLSHRAGLFALGGRADPRIKADPDQASELASPTKTRLGTEEHARLLMLSPSASTRAGFTPTSRPKTQKRLGQCFHQEIATPIRYRILHRPTGRYSRFQVDEKSYGRSSTRSIQSTHPANACGGISSL